MFEILTLNEISPKIYAALGEGYKVTKEAENPDAIIVRSYNMADCEIKENLLAVARAGAGVNNIPIPRMTEAGVAVFNTPGANANAVKELTLAALFLSSRGIVEGINWANKALADKGSEVPKLVEKGKSQFGGTEIIGKTLGIIGLGAIGVKVANAAIALGMKVIGYDICLTCEYKAELSPEAELVDLDYLYENSDYITLHLPLLEGTKNMINARILEKIKPGAVIINLSRAELADAAAIKDSLKSGKLRSYVVDFPTAETLNTDGIIAIPHLGASTEEAEENCAVAAAVQLKDYLENGNVKNSVNFPALSVPRKAKNRAAVVYNAGRGVIENIKETLAGVDYSLSFAEKKDLGYALIDSDINFWSEDLSFAEKVADTDDIISVRIL